VRFVHAIIPVAVTGMSLVFASVVIAAPLPTLPTNDAATPSHGLQVKPYLIRTTGDRTEFLGGRRQQGRRFGRLHWGAWTTEHSVGAGIAWDNNCDPDCGSGTFIGYPINLRAFRARQLGGRLVFTRLTLTYTNRRPAYQKSRSLTIPIEYANGEFGY
jgi:hypothetical protein